MDIHYVVEIDLTPAVDEHGTPDERAATRIVYNSSGFPTGANVRLNIAHCRYGCALGQVIEMLSKAGTVEIVGSEPAGVQRIGHVLKGGDPLDRLVF